MLHAHEHRAAPSPLLPGHRGGGQRDPGRDEALDAGRLRQWPLRLSHAWSAFGPYTTPLLRRWQQEHADTPLELLRIDDRTADLTRGEVDAAVLRGPVTTPGLVTELLFTEPRVAAVTADGPRRRAHHWRSRT